MKKNIIFILISLIYTQSEQPYPPLDLVTIPTAGTLPRGSYTYETVLSKNGTFMPKLSIGLTHNLTIGISYGIQELIGNEDPIYNPQPGFSVKYRAYEENSKIPAIVIGLNTQGKGIYQSTSIPTEIARYEQKAHGFYVAASRNWKLLGNLGLHMGLSKNIWESSGDPNDDDDINLFFGIDKEINRSFSFLIEYDAALNDNEDEYDPEDITIGRGKGFLNAGIRWTVVPNVMIEINFNDIRKNMDGAEYTNREIKFMYSESF